MFVHRPVPRHDELKQVTLENGRYYQLPDGTKFASVTTVIDKSDFFDKSWIAKWIERVGKEEADRKKREALMLGEYVHRLAEKFVANDPDYKKGAMPPELGLFNKFREHLALNVGIVRGQELPLYSTTWSTAGKADLIAVWKGKLSVIDFKTAAMAKEEKEIEHYFVQASVYGLMYNELYSERKPIEDIVIIHVHQESKYPQIFEKKIADFMPQIETIFRNNSCLALFDSP